MTLLAVLVAVGLALVAAALWGLSRRLEDSRGKEQSLALLQQQLESLRAQLASSLLENQKLADQKLAALTSEVGARLSDVSRSLAAAQESVGGRMDKAASVVGEVQRSLGALGQQSQRILEVGQDIAALQEILRAPKLRGSLGELFLGELLAQILPASHFELQYRFKSGEAVDAVVRVGGRLVPVDSKFPLENFKRVLEASEEEKKAARRRFAADVKKHVDAVASKYILPDEGTYDFALMYIPAENVYYETIVKDDAEEGKSIAACALERRVVPVSPNSIYAYLQVIALGLRGLKVEEQARAILEHLSRLKGETARLAESFELLGKHLGNAQKAYQETEKRLDRLDDKLESLNALPAAQPTLQPNLPPQRGEGVLE